jgi:Cof subfamily protein (haloacid dehalogenase superfamily)
MSRIALIATDLDGTLLRSDGTISARSRSAIAAAHEAGLQIAFVTARPPRVMRHFAEHVGLSGMAVCSNGAILYDLARDEFISHERLEMTVARELIDLLRAQSPAIVFATEHGHSLAYEPDFPQFFDEPDDPSGPRIDHAHRLCQDELTKLLVHHPDHGPDSLIELVSAHVGSRAYVNHSGGAFVEIGAPGVSKASGLARLCVQLGVAADQVIAFGDMPNDLPMLKFAGRGVAVANAHADVLAAADEVTASNDEDGVAKAIEALLASASFDTPLRGGSG